MRLRSSFLQSILFMLCIWATGCDPRQMPGFREKAIREEQRITNETREAIKNSSSLQELNRLCTEEIPHPNGFVLVNMSRDFNHGSFLSYGYKSLLDYPSVKRFYIDYFSHQGWQVVEDKHGGWGPRKVEFRNATFKFVLYDRGSRENYGLVCGRL